MGGGPIGRHSNVKKNSENFSERNAKNSLPLPRNREKNEKN